MTDLSKLLSDLRFRADSKGFGPDTELYQRALSALERMKAALEALLLYAETCEVTMDGHFGLVRTLAEIEKDGDLAPSIVHARGVLR